MKIEIAMPTQHASIDILVRDRAAKIIHLPLRSVIHSSLLRHLFHHCVISTSSPLDDYFNYSVSIPH